MSQNWPDTLPQMWLQEGYQETLPETAIRSQMDAGPAKVRRRFTAQVTPFKAKMTMTAAQKGYLETYYKTTTAGGSLSFTFPHDGSDVLRFVKPPVFTDKSGGNYGVDFELEKLP
jgi:hypothetical protein